jgi:hypothetical protein
MCLGFSAILPEALCLRASAVRRSGVSQRAHGDDDRARRTIASGLVVLAAVALLGAGGAGAVTPATDTIRALPVTAGLKDEIRASYYRAYRTDPGDLALPAGQPFAAFVVPDIDKAGTMVGLSPAATPTWVVGAVCLRANPVACQDAGGFQAFYRPGPSGPFVFVPGGLCVLPAAVAADWFPGGRYPLGISCPARNALAERGGIRAGVWTAIVPHTWLHVPCGGAASARLRQSLCSFEGGDTDSDVWFNPADTNELLEVTTCRGGGCFPLAASGGPRLVAKPGESRLAAWEVGFHAAPDDPQRSGYAAGSGAISGRVLAAHSGETLSYPVFTVEVELPPSQSALATAMVGSFAPCLVPGATLAGAPTCP